MNLPASADATAAGRPVGTGSGARIEALPTARADKPFVRFAGVQKTYDGDTLVVRSLDLDIRRGEFLSLLGPSGSGKTTCLMMLAGFESPTAGEIMLNGQPITRTPPHKRDFGMVFQNYALFPHMTVAQNVAYPLVVRKVPRSEVAQRVTRALAMVQLTGKDERHPAQLSGGQQQRVALARALVFEPQLVLMDEPLGALDKQLREHMQLELKALHRQLGVTFVYVTHDQGEALTMSDRVAVFNEGAIQQIDSVERLYETPANRFVAGFVGDSTELHGTVGARQPARGRRPCAGAARTHRGPPQCPALHRQRAEGRGQRRHLFRRPLAPALCLAIAGRGDGQAAAVAGLATGPATGRGPSRLAAHSAGPPAHLCLTASGRGIPFTHSIQETP
jgi:ABC-type Fe3+/spermidine/putrescine transport system ATPase subunit